MNILTLLEKNKTKALSGEIIADTLSMTRANVWKEINKRRKQGYDIIAAPSKGYQLIGYQDNYSKYLLEEALQGISVEIYDTLTSTNNLAKESNEINRLIITKTQTQGRGRMGKSFYSPDNKGLYFSYVIQPNLELEMVPLVTIAAALAIHSALPINTDIKWLNDILINNKKVAGILVEGDIELQTRKFNKIIVGVGINLFNSIVPQELKNIITNLESNTDKIIDKHKILIEFIHELNKRVLEITSNKEKLIEDYRKQCVTLNKELVFEDTVYTAIDINEHGHLIVKDKLGNKKTIQAGEIHDHN